MADIYIDEKISQFITAIITATRTGKRIKRGAPVELHAQLVEAAKDHARASQRKYVTPQDVKETMIGQLRGKVIWDDDVAPAQVDELLAAVLDNVEVP